MLRILRLSLVLLLAGTFAPKVAGFALLGPYSTNQIERIGYNVHGWDIGGPMVLGEEYRWNLPIITYAFDASFLQFFGSNGVRAVDRAFDLMNSITTNLTKYSVDLHEFPQEAQRVNYRAQALGIYDLKSYTLSYLMEELGLASPDRYVWCLMSRTTFSNPDFTNYVVIQRNYDPVTLKPSSYVNGVLYTYTVFDQYAINPDVADAIEYTVDPLRNADTAVASAIDNTLTHRTFLPGRFFNTLTRDDVGGLRYLFRYNNFKQENLPANADLAVTNYNALQIVTTSNIVDLISNTWNTTNNPAQVQAIYPFLNLTSTNYYLTNLTVTNVYYYYTNYWWEPWGTPPTLTSNVVYSYVPTIAYQYTFDNVVTNRYSPWSLLTYQVTTIGTAPWAPLGTVSTNTSAYSYWSNTPSGDFYIVPATNYAYQVVQNMLSTVVTNTNTLSVVTNYITNSVLTNIAITNVIMTSTQRDLISYFTNAAFAIYPVEWRNDTNTFGLRPGVQSMLFRRVNYDSLIGTVFTPVTNYFTDTMVTNGVAVKRLVRLRTNTPDIIFDARDCGLDTGGYPVQSQRTSTAGWQNNSLLNRSAPAAGPGVIQPPIRISYSNVGAWLANETPSFLTEANSFVGFIWGSFDGSTNAPVVYPDTGANTLDYLEQQIFGNR